MPDLSSAFSSVLPSLTGAIGSVKDKAVNYAMAGPTALLTEGLDKVTKVFSTNPFSKLSQAFTPPKVVVPPEVLGSAASIRANTQSDPIDDDTGHKVKLVASTSDGESSVIKNDANFPHEPLMERVVEFDVMPEVQEIHSAEYEPLSAPQMPLEFQKYKGTKSIQWQINGTFTCRTRDEALRNYIYLSNLRGWTKPYFGEKQRQQFSGSGKLGAPPPVLTFSGWRSLVGAVPVVITSLNWNWPKDCDWIPTGIKDGDGKEIPFPTVMQVNISMVESFSPDQVNGFDLVQFRNGRMVDAWRPYASPSAVKVSEAVGGNGGNQSVIKGTPQPHKGRGNAEASSVAPVVAQGSPGAGSTTPVPQATTATQITALTKLRKQYTELRDDYVATAKSTVEEAKVLVANGQGGTPAFAQTRVTLNNVIASVQSIDRDIATVDTKLNTLRGGT